MDGIWRELQNPVWWFSVVAAGIVINVLASCIMRGFVDRLWTRWSDTRQESVRARVAEREARVELMARDYEQLQRAHFDEARNRLRSLNLLALGGGLAALVNVGPVQVFGNIVTFSDWSMALLLSLRVLAMSAVAGSLFLAFPVFMHARAVRSEIREAEAVR